ncbi:UDP-N-acetylmuramoyl-L-alanyl-D-glutamate--2,6-diaminopimelate ligase [Lysinibacter sp. HNR]|uniref:UDP-N-acetylmuramoyl-L-alanyl-D-glutamate--2, 6-diaminopimelate ligase n=1 Tax=Lysinibacter sp. HNR TaxID=3031408 RepID=UPI0024351623|nr:UDP-N-acetylmuramoyl-L-alanyl-D-glutamate--2,6-diaminopimelate ligase [Lysinibacter sp. HNR]WGD36396.1 UDP-N-acetylmuramoyl-L-alanyl-D-glutamate--2,6-diaminopimelate ligase [Lysinibacter sp. HNR]
MRSAPEYRLHLETYDSRHAGTTLAGLRLVQNSRDVQPGDIFVAVGSTGADGSAFIGHGFAQGASYALYDASVDISTLNLSPSAHATAFPIARLHQQLGTIADDFYGHPSRDLTLVGVTGTNGKTSVVQLLNQAWNLLGIRSASMGTLGAGVYGSPNITTGLTTPPVTQVHEFLANFREEGATRVALEVSSHALQQGRVAGARFSTAAFTNLTRDHLDYHRTMERYAAEKAKIFSLPEVTGAVINLDDVQGERFFEHQASHLRRVGVSSQGHPAALLAAHNVQLSPDGIQATLRYGKEEYPFATTLLGRFNIDNLLICAGVLLLEGVEPAVVFNILGQLQPVFGRMNRIQPDPSLPLVIVDYAHSPDALSQSLAALKEHTRGRIVTVFGCTGDRDRGKRPEMARIAEEASDLVVVTDDDVHFEDGDQILDDIRRGFKHPERVVEQRDRGLAIEHAIDHAVAGDIVLIAGKGHESAMIVGDELVHFSDTEHTLALLTARLAR